MESISLSQRQSVSRSAVYREIGQQTYHGCGGAMRACGAGTIQIDNLMHSLREGTGVLVALKEVDIPECNRSFVYRTLSTAMQDQPFEVAAAFVFER